MKSRSVLAKDQVQEIALIQVGLHHMVSSKLIAKRIGKRHDNIVQTIERLSEKLLKIEIGLLRRQETPSSFLSRLWVPAEAEIDSQGKPQKAYLLTLQGFYRLLAQYLDEETFIFSRQIEVAFDKILSEAAQTKQKLKEAEHDNKELEDQLHLPEGKRHRLTQSWGAFEVQVNDKGDLEANTRLEHRANLSRFQFIFGKRLKLYPKMLGQVREIERLDTELRHNFGIAFTLEKPFIAEKKPALLEKLYVQK